jgi:hypothetical protein
VLVTLPIELLTTTSKVAESSAAVVGGVVWLAPFAEVMLAPFFRHWKVGGGLPLATTLKVADCPTVTVWLAGCMVMDAAAGWGLLLGGALWRTFPAQLTKDRVVKTVEKRISKRLARTCRRTQTLRSVKMRLGCTTSDKRPRQENRGVSSPSAGHYFFRALQG